MKVLKICVVVLFMIISLTTIVNASQEDNNPNLTPSILPELDMAGLNTDIELIEVDLEIMNATPDWIVLVHDEEGKSSLIEDIDRSDLSPEESDTIKNSLTNLWNTYPVKTVDGGEKTIELTSQTDGSNEIVTVPIGHVTYIQFDREKIKQAALNKKSIQATELQTLSSLSVITLSEAENQTIKNLTKLRSKLYKKEQGSQRQDHSQDDSSQSVNPEISFPASDSYSSGFSIPSSYSDDSIYPSHFINDKGLKNGGLRAWGGDPGVSPHGSHSSDPNNYFGHNAFVYWASVNHGFPLTFNAADVATEPDGWPQEMTQSVILPLTEEQKTIFEAVIHSWDHYYNPDRDTGFAPSFTYYWAYQAWGNYTANPLSSALYLGWASHFLTDVSNPEHTGFEFEQYADRAFGGYDTHSAYEGYVSAMWDQTHAGQTGTSTFHQIVKNQENINYRITNPNTATKNIAKFSHAYLPTLYYRVANQPYIDSNHRGFYDDATVGRITDNCLRVAARYTGGLVDYTQSHTINEIPIADFTANPVFLLSGGTVQFLDKTQYSGPLTTHVDWDFGDGLAHYTADPPYPYTAVNPPAHQYSTPGVYTVNLTVSNGDGVTSKTMDIVVGDWPIANFSAEPVVNEPAYTYHFTDESTNNPNHWTWDFGDGSTSTEQNPNHKFESIRNYDITLVASNTAGPGKVTKTIIPFSSKPIAIFIISGGKNGPAPLVTQFEDDSVGWIDSRTWDFGDNTSSNEKDPTHVYNYSGNFTVKLTVISSGAGTSTNTSTITVTPPLPPLPNFTASPTSGLAPLTVTFTNLTSPPPESGVWDFGDNSSENATESNPVHTYLLPGPYDVSLNVTNSYGISNTTTIVDYINVTAPPPPTANFTATPRSGIAPLAIQFSDTTTGNATGWNWTFGDGNLTDTSVQNPVHLYQSPGNYTVSLKASNLWGNTTKTETNYISVPAIEYPYGTATGWNTIAPTEPVGAFDKNLTSYWVGDRNSWIQMDYGPSMQRQINQYTISADPFSGVTGPHEWNFYGSWDGTNWTKLDYRTTSDWTGDMESRIFTFPNDNVYQYYRFWMWYEFSDITPRQGFHELELAYSPFVLPYANFTAVPTSGGSPLTVRFTDASVGNVSDWKWDFGDGNPTNSTERNPVHTYANGGIYPVSLNVTNTVGFNTTTKTNYISVGLAPSANFTTSSRYGIAPHVVSFTETSTGSPTIWNWDFGDGDETNTSNQNPIHAYRNPGNYSISLEASNAFGNSTRTQPGYILIPAIEYPYGTATGWNTISPTLPVRAFDNNNLTYWAGDRNSWIQMDYGSGNSHVINQLNITIKPVAGFTGPASWNFYGSPDGIYWTKLDTRTSSAWGSNPVSRLFSFPNNGSYQFYRFWMTYSQTYPKQGFGELELLYNGSSSPPEVIATPLSGTVPLTVSFLGNSSVLPDSWTWDFGDGDSTNATVQNPVHTYRAAGIYSVNLTVSNSTVGIKTVEKPMFITVNEIPRTITPWNSISGPYTIVTFNGTGTTTWTAPANVTVIDYLIVAGGGGGGGTRIGGGGGAGGMLTGLDYSVVPLTAYMVTIGPGGMGGGANQNGGDGGNSSFDTINSAGGGGGGVMLGGTESGRNGGSGGGTVYYNPGGLGIPGQGTNGGRGTDSTAYGTGGGGGAGAAGSNGSSAAGGSGGNGLSSNITGIPIFYAGGGGGAADQSLVAGTGGSGGGGRGAGLFKGTSGTSDLGGGGGGGHVYGINYLNGGNGGSGVVVIRYLTL